MKKKPRTSQIKKTAVKNNQIKIIIERSDDSYSAYAKIWLEYTVRAALWTKPNSLL